MIALSVIPGLVSCSDYLKEKPTTRLVEYSAFASEKSVESLLFGVYSQIGSMYVGNGSRVYYFQFASPLLHWKSTRSGQQFEQGLRGTLYYDQSAGASLMQNCYSAIYCCNNIIGGLKDSELPQQFISEALGEACFLRAMMYFDLVRLFGDVPLNLEAAGDYAHTSGPRVIYSEIYKAILDDLKFAELNMRTSARQKEVNGLYSGRAFRTAATALKAEVYLQIASLLHSPDDQAFGTLETGYEKPAAELFGMTEAQAWKSALDAADAVIASGDYALEDNFSHLFRWDPENHIEDYRSPERIIAFQVTTNGCSSMLTNYTLPAFLVGTAVTSSHASTESMVRPCNYVFQKWARTYGGTFKDTGEGLYTSCNDPRIDATLLYNQYETYGSNDDGIFDAPKTTKCYPASLSSATTFIRKYFCPSFKNDAGCADYYYMRFAQMYLIAAEAAAELGSDGALGSPYDYIEVLHARARNESSTGQPRWTAGQFATKDELVNAIMWERVFEMFGEYHEWFDTHRRGSRWLLENIYAPIDAFLKAPNQEKYKEQYWYHLGFELPLTLHNTRCGLLCEFPESEVRSNKALSESKDRNVFNQSLANFGGTASGNGSNVNFGDDENFNW